MKRLQIIEKTALLVMMLFSLVAGLPAQAQSCQFTGALDTLTIYHAPLTHSSQVKDILPGGVAYAVRQASGEHYLIVVDDAYGGWVDRRSGFTAGSCDAIPVSPLPLADFPTICMYAAPTPQPSYNDSALTIAMDTIPANQTFPVVEFTPEAYLLYLDHARGAWVAAGSGTLTGGCDVLPPNGEMATALENARVWSAPTVSGDSALVATLPEGSRLAVISGPVRGAVRTDSVVQGDWYQIQQGVVSGWVWSERLQFDGSVPPPPAGTLVTVLDNAGVWDRPDVNTGSLITTLAPGSTATIVSGPVTGTIELDSELEGWWYQVEQGTVSGWVWAARLRFGRG